VYASGFLGGSTLLMEYSPARDRIALLLDPDSAFLELCSFAGYGQEGVPACGNLISGIGSIWQVAAASLPNMRTIQHANPKAS
jgi:acetyl-CoA carboxylase carboxyltransferase component